MTTQTPAPDTEDALETAAPADLPPTDQALIGRIVEAALMAATAPLNLVQLHGLFPLDAPAPEGAVQQALTDLQAACAERGVELVEVASGWRFQVKAEVHPWVARLWTERTTKYTRATLETLALIAYRQPITRGEIEQIRGVAINSAIVKALEEREWIRVVGHRDVPGKPELLATTKTFLDYFGLKTLEDLPPLSELRDITELDPQLPFAAPIAANAEPAPKQDDDADTDAASSTTDDDADTDAASSTTDDDADTYAASRTTDDDAEKDAASRTADDDADTDAAPSTTDDDAENDAAPSNTDDDADTDTASPLPDAPRDDAAAASSEPDAHD